MVKRLAGALVLVGLLILILPGAPVSAIRGAPGSSEFGFGARLDLDGEFVHDGIQLANNLHLDWISLEMPWKRIQTSPSADIDWSGYDAIFQDLAHFKIATLVSLTQPPDWSQTSAGPDPAAAAQFVEQLISRYGPDITALELFPSANTCQGWGRQPDPAAYLSLYRQVAQQLQAQQSSVILVAAGLVPVAVEASDCLQGDVEFLQGMYQAGAGDIIPVISIRLPGLAAAPSAAPKDRASLVLRHYEILRDVMVKNGHQKGLLWITEMSVTANPEIQADNYTSAAYKQAAWLLQAYQQLRSQLYVGVAFINNLNPPASGSILGEGMTLILPSGDLHPAYRVLRDQIAQNSSGGANPRPGRPKGDFLSKGR